MWKHTPSHREKLLWSQCSKQTTSLEEQTISTERTSATGRIEQYNQECLGSGRSFQLNLPCLHSGTACHRPETTKLITLFPTPEVVWQQPPETSVDIFKLNNTNKFATTVTTQTAHTTDPRHWNDIELQLSSRKRILLQVSGTATEQFWHNEARRGLVLFHNNSQNCINETEGEALTLQPIAMETTIFFFPQ